MNFKSLTKVPTNEILEGSFGIEWESLRVNGEGELSLTPHPEIFGDKFTNPLITTDFSESQIEIITPAFDTIDEAFPHFRCYPIWSTPPFRKTSIFGSSQFQVSCPIGTRFP